MSSKSKARLPAEPLISIRMAFLRPVAKRVASKTPERAAGEVADEDRGVVDGHRAALAARAAAAERAGGVAGGDRALLDEGLEPPGDLGDPSGR